MPVTVIVNKLTVSHAGSNGTSIAFPDVCKTPSPGGPIPIPYPNIAMSKDTSKGSKKVKMDGKSIMLKDSEISMSTGDEAGSLQGVASNKIKGKAKFVNYSFDVKVEGKNVCRLSDPTTQNQGSAPNGAAFFHIQSPAVAFAGPLEECKETKKEEGKQKTEESKWGRSGIIREHRPKLESAAEKLKVILYFRATNPLCEPWIRAKHMPKPHEVIQANTIKPEYLPAVRKWLKENVDPSTRQTEDPPYSYSAEYYLGIVMSTGSMDMGRPMRGYGKYSGKWITGDYDLMDVMRVGDDCVRPTHGAFGRVQRVVNKTLKWDAIQHGPQSTFEDIGNPDELTKYLNDKDATTPHKRPIPKTDRSLPVCDNKLTVVAPGGRVIFLETDKQVKDALICSGCQKGQTASEDNLDASRKGK